VFRIIEHCCQKAYHTMASMCYGLPWRLAHQINVPNHKVPILVFIPELGAGHDDEPLGYGGSKIFRWGCRAERGPRRARLKALGITLERTHVQRRYSSNIHSTMLSRPFYFPCSLAFPTKPLLIAHYIRLVVRSPWPSIFS
jgi:hypothetical protein